MTETHEALHDAIRSRNTQQVDHLLGLGLQPCYEDYKENCFHLARDVGKITFLRKLLERQPARINCRDAHGNTLLIRANRRKYLHLLAKFNPDPQLCNNQGDNILLSIIKTHINLDSVLLCSVLDTGVNINSKDVHGKTALEYAVHCKSGGGILFEILLRNQAMLPPPDENGQTILMRVVRELRHYSVFHVTRCLLEYGWADIFERDNEGRTAMHHAILGFIGTNRSPLQLFDITRMLFKYGCPLDCTDLKFELYVCHSSNCGTMTNILSRDNKAKYDIISLFFQHLDIALVCYMFSRWLFQNKYIQGENISPVTTYLLNFVTIPVLDNLEHKNMGIDHCLRKFLQHDVSWSQRVFRFRDETVMEWSDELNLPDTLWLYFLMFCKKRGNVVSLWMLLRATWPHHPLCLLLFPLATEIWRVANQQHITPIHMIKALTFGGPMMPNSRHFHAVRGRLETLGPAYQPALEKFIQIHGRVQSLRELCRLHVRASFAEQAASGVDLTKAVSDLFIPIELKNYLNFK